CARGGGTYYLNYLDYW
nr:immunoglobulin heavy chain junction region [Macaca mulatta]MOV44709.1 immunoglobulin heavy chain junction region [Macaca mulatta]